MPDYSSTDPIQQAFLAAIRQGENPSGNPYLGTGGTNLAGYPTDAYGFPQWAGVVTSDGPSHAAGLYQDQPATWDATAAQYGLNFQNPADQSAGNWYIAQQAYSRTPGGDLETALQTNPAGVGSALSPTWTSLRSGTFAQRFAQALSGNSTPIVNTGSGPVPIAGGGTTGITTNPLVPSGAANPCTGTLTGFFTWSCWQGIAADLAFVFIGVLVFLLAIASGLFGTGTERAVRSYARLLPSTRVTHSLSSPKPEPERNDHEPGKPPPRPPSDKENAAALRRRARQRSHMIKHGKYT